MSNITRSAFNNTLKHGVDLKKLEIGKELQDQGINKADIQKLDTNNDGFIKGNELNGLFNYTDGFDKNGSGRSFATDQTGGVLYGALKKARTPRPFYGQAIAKAAADRVKTDGDGYGFYNAPTSPLKELSGNRVPGQSRPSWLKDNNKCNQFVGDALTQAGVAMPTFTMSDGTKHYKNAERLPHDKKHFDRITDPKDLKPGDVFVVDYPGSGLSSAHTEVITGVNSKDGTILSTGAHSSGAYEEDKSDLLKDAKYNAAKQCWNAPGGDDIYLLRPIKKLD